MLAFRTSITLGVTPFTPESWSSGAQDAAIDRPDRRLIAVHRSCKSCSESGTPACCSGPRSRSASSVAEELFKSIIPLEEPPNIPRSVSSINWRLAFNSFSSLISVPIKTSGFPLTCCTEISPGSLLSSAARICCTGGSWAKRSDIWAPPLKSIP